MTHIFHIGLRDRTFNLKAGVGGWGGGEYGFLFRSEFYFRTTQEFEFFFVAQRAKLYDKKLFFPPPKSEYFFQQQWESEYFFRKNHHSPPPPPPPPPPPHFKLNSRSLNYASVLKLFCVNIFVLSSVFSCCVFFFQIIKRKSYVVICIKLTE